MPMAAMARGAARGPGGARHAGWITRVEGRRNRRWLSAAPLPRRESLGKPRHRQLQQPSWIWLLLPAAQLPHQSGKVGWAQPCPCPPTRRGRGGGGGGPTYQVLQQHRLVRDLRRSPEPPVSKRREERQSRGHSRIRPAAPQCQGAPPSPQGRVAHAEPQARGATGDRGSHRGGDSKTPASQPCPAL